LSYLGLAEATVVSFTSPLFIVALAGPVLSEQVTWQRWLAVCLGLLGAVIVVRPGTAVFQWAALLPLAGAVFFSFFHLLTRMIGTADRPFTTLFYTICGGTLMLSAAMPAVWSPMTGLGVAVAFLSGSVGLLAHGALVRALGLADASALAPMNYVRLVWAIGIGYVVFAEVPDPFTLVGGAIIVGSGLYVVHSAATR
jgi:drug/metabolite transporter (DMT)-like permease